MRGSERANILLPCSIELRGIFEREKDGGGGGGWEGYISVGQTSSQTVLPRNYVYGLRLELTGASVQPDCRTVGSSGGGL